MNKFSVASNQFRRVLIWVAVVGLIPILAVQFVGASPAVQEDDPVPGMAFPELGESGAPLTPVLVEQKAAPALDAAAEPEIDVWYGLAQNFGQNGNPQPWVDVLGNVQASEGVQSLTYKLNGQDKGSLNVGSNLRRLYREGDFHIELPINELLNGNNAVEINLREKGGATITETVQVNYTQNIDWSLPYTADWSSTGNPQQISQVVDGYWKIENNKLQLVDNQVGYDRLVVFGEAIDPLNSWTDYEATVPFTIRGIDPDGFKHPSNGPGVGVILRWTGYEQVANEQPRNGWENLGAIAWNRYKLNKTTGQVSQGLQMIGYSVGAGGSGNILTENPSVQLQFDVPYIYKASVQTVPAGGDIYRLKVWRQGDPEPYNWDMVGVGDPNEPSRGSFALLVHHVDVEIGNVSIKPLNNALTLQALKSGDGGPPVVAPVQATYAYGQQVSITAFPDPGQKLARWDGVAAGVANPLQLTLTEDTVATAVYVPDVKQTLTVATSGGDGSVAVSPNRGNKEYLLGERVQVTATPAAGFEFVQWQTSTAAATQAVANSTANPYTFIFGDDATSVTAVFKQSTQYALNTETTGTGSGSITKTPTGTTFYDGTIVEVMAVPDAGSQFTDWNGANSGQTNPFYVLMDQGRTVSAEFEAVEGTYKLTIDPNTPNGTINANPDKEDYLFGESVTITAVADEGYMLGEWGGDLAGNANPRTIQMFDNYSVSATFIEATEPVSDDFNRCFVDNGQWTTYDPLGDVSIRANGTHLEMLLPAGSPHDLFGDTNTVPRILTPADDEEDLSLLVKFDSPVNEKFQSMGIIIQEDEDKLLRFDFFYDGSATHIYAAAWEDGKATSKKVDKMPAAIQGASPLWMRVVRDGDNWTQAYSTNGSSFTNVTPKFSYNMTVNEAGVFAGNPSPNAAQPAQAPGFTASFDYFFNAKQPINPQDTVLNTIAVKINGQGTVDYDQQASYACGEVVEFKANPAQGYNFAGWSGALSGLQNPGKLTVTGVHEVIANFTTGPVAGPNLYLPIVRRN